MKIKVAIKLVLQRMKLALANYAFTTLRLSLIIIIIDDGL